VERSPDLLEQERRVEPSAEARTVPADLLERLGALGYVSGSPSTTSTPGADPKDKILDFRPSSAVTDERASRAGYTPTST